MRNRVAVLNPRRENDGLVVYTDADDSTTFDPSWTFSTGTTGSRDFAGATSRIDWASPWTPSGAMTVSFWLSADRVNTSQGLWCVAKAGDGYDGIYFWLSGGSTSGQLTFYVEGGTDALIGTVAGIVPNDGSWHNYIVTWDGVVNPFTGAHIYKDGTETSYAAAPTNGATPNTMSGKWSLGGFYALDNYNIDGRMAQVAVWDRVLNSSEIALLAVGNKPNAISTNLKFYFSGETSSLVASPGGTGTADGTTYSTNGPTQSAIMMTVDYGDGTYATNAIGVSKTYAAGKGRHRVRFSCPDWRRLTNFNIENDATALFIPNNLSKCQNLTEVDLQGWITAPNNFVGGLPSFNWCKSLVIINCYGQNGAGAVNQLFGVFPNLSQCTGLQVLNLHQSNFYGPIPDCSVLTALTTVDFSNNRFTGTLPSFAACTAMTTFECGGNLLTGTMPSFNACTLLQILSNGSNAFSGTIPTFAACTALTTVQLGYCSFTGYTAGAFATQKNLATLELQNNSLSAAAVNAILADLVTSLSISGRVACTVTLQNNTAPTGQGITDKNTLNGTSGWSVTTD